MEMVAGLLPPTQHLPLPLPPLDCLLYLFRPSVYPFAICPTPPLCVVVTIPHLYQFSVVGDMACGADRPPIAVVDIVIITGELLYSVSA